MKQNDLKGNENYFDKLFRGTLKLPESMLRKALVGSFIMSGLIASEPAFAHDLPNFMMGDGCSCTNPIMMPVPCPIHGGGLDMN